jgi:hypothetical protein
MKPEALETPEDEAAETPEQQAKEDAEGTEEHGESAIPESFQSAATELVNSCPSKHCLTFLQSLISDKQMEMSEPKKSKSPPEFSLEEAPTD